jgi:hypothetical protein
MNIAEIESSLKQLVEAPFQRTDFIYQFLAIYDAPKSTVTKLRQSNSEDLLSPGDLLWKKKLWFRVAEKGRAPVTVDEMSSARYAKKDSPRFLMATDGIEFYAIDTKTDQRCLQSYATLNDAFDFFLPLAGIERYEGVAENPADIKATARLAKLYDAIIEVNPDWTGSKRTHEMNLLMTRMLFCFFAEDTSIFEKDLFTSTATTLTKDDGSDLQALLATVFESMNTPAGSRNGMPEYARRFPYVNGGLFKDKADIPTFSRRARRLLKDCGELSWKTINPDIFGSMIQAIVDPEMRGDMGMHYTSVPNIMKVLHPLFLLELEDEFEAARDSQAKLHKLLKRIYNIRVLDPACGSGNFLIIAYRELRKLEIRIFVRLKEIGQQALPMTGIRIAQFFGIELADFAAETAKLSLWIAEYQMNEQFKEVFGMAPPMLPLTESGNIVHGNACRLDWLKLCPPDMDRETFVIGNPPYLGSVGQSPEQKEDMRLVFEHLFKKYKDLDLVAAWVLKASHYIQATGAKSAFVTTNSICQGEQVAMLWPLIAKAGVEIGFAHLSFKWANSAAQNAGVTCVVVGLRKRSSALKTIYEGDLARRVKNINAYLIDADDVYVQKRTTPLSDLPKMDLGNKPTDGGHLILSRDERDDLLKHHPEAKAFVRRYSGAKEFIQGVERWCLWITDENLPLAQSIAPITDRISKVRHVRSSSVGSQAQANARTAHRFVYTPHQDTENIIVPCHFSEHRRYLTVGLSNGADEIIGNSASVVFSAPAHIFAILSSRLHLLWTATVGGQLETRLRYANTLVYNTFPIPSLSDEQQQTLEDHAVRILAARERHPGKTIAWMYDPDTMPMDISQAHIDLDETLETIYIGRPFKSDAERLEHLFKRYASEIAVKDLLHKPTRKH